MGNAPANVTCGVRGRGARALQALPGRRVVKRRLAARRQRLSLPAPTVHPLAAPALPPGPADPQVHIDGRQPHQKHKSARARPTSDCCPPPPLPRRHIASAAACPRMPRPVGVDRPFFSAANLLERKRLGEFLDELAKLQVGARGGGGAPGYRLDIGPPPLPCPACPAHATALPPCWCPCAAFVSAQEHVDQPSRQLESCDAEPLPGLPRATALARRDNASTPTLHPSLLTRPARARWPAQPSRRN